jgi:hypothetical protein
MYRVLLSFIPHDDHTSSYIFLPEIYFMFSWVLLSPNTALNEFIATYWIQISWSDICFLPGAVGDASSLIQYSNLIQVGHYIQWIYCCVSNPIFVFLFCRYLGSGSSRLLLVLIQYSKLLVLIQDSNLIQTILCIQWINRCVLNLIFVFLRCDFHALLLMLAAMFLMKPICN